MLLLAFPISMAYVFVFGGDRALSTTWLVTTFIVAIWGLFVTPWLPLKSLQNIGKMGRLELCVTAWFWVCFMSAVGWELPWILMTDKIRAAKDEMWAYPWWAYIDGGDFRYKRFDCTVGSIETLNVASGLMGLSALLVWLRSRRTSVTAKLLLMLSSAASFFLTMVYYLGQTCAGFVDVGHDFFDLYIRFILLNSPWVVMPVVVWAWGIATFARQQRVAR